MSVLAKLADMLSGGLGSKIIDGLKDYFPPSMTEQEKENLKLAIRNQTHQQAIDLQALILKERELFNSRIKELEGTAADLNRFGWLGRIVIFLRGCQRPLWGYITIYMDIMWFSGKWGELSSQQESAFWVINLLVLGFLFGERAVKNLMPLLSEVVKKKVKNE